MRLIDSCITQLTAQAPSRTCSESKKEEEGEACECARGVDCVREIVDVRLPGKGNSNSHGARPVHLIITMIKWIRTSRLSIKNSLSALSLSLFLSLSLYVQHTSYSRSVYDWLVFKAHRLLYHSTLGLRVIKKKKKKRQWCRPVLVSKATLTGR